MKKLGVVLILALLTLAVLFSAGCISENTSLEDKSVLDVIVTKDGGSTYCVGDTMTVNLPDYEYEGYSWQVTYSDGFDIQKKTITPDEAGVGDDYPSYTSFIFTPTSEGYASFVLKFMLEGDESSAKFGYDDSMTILNDGEHTTSTFTYYGNMLPGRGDYVSIIFQKSASTKDCTYETYNGGITSGLSVVKSSILPVGSTYGGDYGATDWIVTSNDIGKYYFGVKEFGPSGEDYGLKFFLSLSFTK